MKQQPEPAVLTKEDTAVPEAIVSEDAKYTANYTEDGVVLFVTYEKGAGATIDVNYFVYDLERRRIEGINLPDILVRIKRQDGIIRLAEAQEEKPADADVAVHINLDEMNASMMLFAPIAGGSKKNAADILDLIRNKWGVTQGLDEAAIIAAVESEKYNSNIQIAAGQKPVRGKNGVLTYMFKTEHTYAPHILDDGSADYKNLDVFESVQADDVVVVSIPPEDGIDGFTVKGAVLPSQKGLVAKLPKGKNVKVSDDGLCLIATKSGRVDCANGRVDVSDVLNISGNVDMSVGNIDFTGDVTVKGNIISGLTVSASGNIEVYGVVEAATLTAGKDIILKNGMQGMDKGMLSAGGNISARFIERTRVDAKGSVCSDYIVHSIVNAMGSVVMKGKHGKIIGGIVRAGKEIITRSIGSPSGDSTLVEIGISPEMRAKLSVLETELAQTNLQMEKMDAIAKVIPLNTDVSPEKAAYFQKLINLKEQLEKSHIQLTEEIESVKKILSEKSGGKVHAISTVYQDVKIIIDSCQLTIKPSVDFATFRYKEGEVVISPCEKSSH